MLSWTSFYEFLSTNTIIRFSSNAIFYGARAIHHFIVAIITDGIFCFQFHRTVSNGARQSAFSVLRYSSGRTSQRCYQFRCQTAAQTGIYYFVFLTYTFFSVFIIRIEQNQALIELFKTEYFKCRYIKTINILNQNQILKKYIEYNFFLFLALHFLGTFFFIEFLILFLRQIFLCFVDFVKNRCFVPNLMKENLNDPFV